MKDWRGVPVYAGDQVMYVTRRSSSLYLHEGVVELVEGDGARIKVTRSTQTWRDFDKPVWVGGNYLTVMPFGGAPPDDTA